MVGYFSLLNETGQLLMAKGENTITQKLCNLPFHYFSDKKLKEILFPTLIALGYKNTRIYEIMDQEIAFESIVKFIENNLRDELPRIMEDE